VKMISPTIRDYYSFNTKYFAILSILRHVVILSVAAPRSLSCRMPIVNTPMAWLAERSNLAFSRSTNANERDYVKYIGSQSVNHRLDNKKDRNKRKVLI